MAFRDVKIVNIGFAMAVVAFLSLNCALPTWALSSDPGSSFDRYVYFDGEDDYVDFGGGSSLNISNELTIEAWLNVSETNGRMAILAKSDWESGCQYSFTLQDGRLSLRTDGGTGVDGIVDGAAVGGHVIEEGTWHHVAVVRSEMETKFYVDAIVGHTHGSLDLRATMKTIPNTKSCLHRRTRVRGTKRGHEKNDSCHERKKKRSYCEHRSGEKLVA